MEMKHIIYNSITIVLAVFLLAPGEVSANTDSLRYSMPLSITANRGQWDDHVRYAIIGNGSALWFCDDEIVIERPADLQAMPGESPGRGHASGTEVIRIAFPNRSPQCSLQALDTLRGVANFYRNNERSTWFESVPTHGGIRYRGIAEGVDLEIRCGQRNFSRTGDNEQENSDHIEWNITSSKQSYQQPVATVSNSSRQLRSWLNAQDLHSFLSSVGYDTNPYQTSYDTYYGIAAENETVAMLGSTRNPNFPVSNAIQGVKRDSLDYVVVCYDAAERYVRFSTYLGSDANDISWAPLQSAIAEPAIGTSRSGNLRVSSGEVFLGLAGGDEFPIVRNLPGASPPEWPTSQAVLAKLDTAGHLTASTFLGGPGVVNPYCIQLHDGKLYCYGGVTGKPLRQITLDAVESVAELDSWVDAACGYFAVLTSDLDSLLYATYHDPTSKQGGWVNTARSPVLAVSEIDGSVSILILKSNADENETPLIHPAMNQSVVLETGVGAYIVTLSPSLNSYKYATYLGFHDRSFYPSNLCYGDNGDIYVAGFAWTWGEVDTLEIPGIWRRYTAVGNYQRSLIVFHMSPTGELLGGLELGTNSGGAVEHLAPDLCGGITMSGYLIDDVHDGLRMPFINEIDTTLNWWKNRTQQWEQFIVSFDAQTMEPTLSSLWNHRFVQPGVEGGHSIQSRDNGYILWSTWYKHKTPSFPGDWHMLGPVDIVGYCAADIRIPTPCWTILCDIQTLDTLHLERRRGYALPQEFDIRYEVSNASTLKQAQILQALIEVPPGFELVSGQPAQPMTPALITPGTSATCTWRVRVANPVALLDTALIRCRVMYYDPESGETYPAAEELCEKDIVVVRFDEPEKNIVCTIDGPDSLFWTGNGFAATAQGAAGPIRYTATYTNLEYDTIDITSFHFRALEHCSVAGGPVRPGIRLAPGASHVLPVDVEVRAMPFARMIRVEAEARDSYDVPISSCLTETHVPGVRDLPCAVTGPAQIRWHPKSGLVYPGLLALTLHLDNPLDTVRTDVRAWVDTSSAPHLSLAGGEAPARAPVDIAAGASYEPYWRFVLANPPSSPARDTIRFIYETDGVQYECMYVITIDVILIEKSVICDLVGTDSLSIAQIQSRTQAQLHYTLTNTGTVTVDVDRYELAITPAAGFSEAGLMSLDPLTRAGTSIDPGNDITLDWNLRAHILRASRTAVCTVTAYDANDSALAVCTHEITLEGLDGLTCSMSATDTIRFNRAELRYDPEEIIADFTLENLLDTEETNIEALIDLAQAPRLALASSESASKTISVIASHTTANLAWQLLPQPAPRAESQEIVVLYKSEQMTAWQECRVTVFIEAWPEEVTVTCATGGHDSLYADAHYEQFIPDPLHVSYTVTNTGTVALTGCEASIILPPEFALAGSDSTQSFTSPEYGNEPGGPVAEGTILPNASCTRWWKITPTQAIADIDPKQIRWQWTSDQQGEQSGCERTMHIIPDNPQSIVLTPLHLQFEAERGGALPSAQNLQLWTGGGLVMPWTAQPSEWWLGAEPVSGSQSAQIAVQPNSTQLAEGAHGAEILLAAMTANRRVAVTYIIHTSTGTGEPPATGALTLDAWPQPVPSGTRLHVRIGDLTGERLSGETCRLTLHDLLGRERFSQEVESNRTATVDLGAAQLNPGVYLLRAVSEDGAQAVRMVSVVR